MSTLKNNLVYLVKVHYGQTVVLHTLPCIPHLITEEVMVVRYSACARKILCGIVIALSGWNGHMDISFNRNLLITLFLKFV